MGLEKLLDNSPTAYYFIGYLMADGHLDFNHKSISISLAEKDKNQVKLISKLLESKISYRELPYYFNENNYGISKQWRTTKSDVKNFIKIVKKFGFRPRKTYNPPTKLQIRNNNLFLSMLIGFIDGDGDIQTNGTIRITSHSVWKNILNQWFLRVWKLSKCTQYNKRFKKPKARINKNGLCKISITNYDFILFLKQKTKELNLPVLKRKWNRITNKMVSFGTKLERIKKRDKKILFWLNKMKMANWISKKLKINISEVENCKQRFMRTQFRPNSWKGKGKLNILAMRSLRQDYATGMFTHKALAKKYNIHYNTVYRLLNRITCKNL